MSDRYNDFELRSFCVSEYLKKGIQNAITARQLCEILHCNPRAVSLQVEYERRRGVPICATCGLGNNRGYFLAETKSEMMDYCQRLLVRGKEIFITRQACLKTIETLPEMVKA
jgi:hypothetical protein